jgi:thiosulfate dehydrogenase [quinone] large subunit
MMEGILTKTQQGAIAVLRVATGIVFMTAGLEKFIATEAFNAAGFLKLGTNGVPYLGEAAEGVVYNPTHDFWVSLAGNATLMPIVNWLVVFGEVAIGVALILGLFTRFASLTGTLMMAFFFVAAWSFGHGIVNEQLMYALVTGVLGVVAAGRYYGLDGVLEKATAIRRAPQLRYVMG